MSVNRAGHQRTVPCIDCRICLGEDEELLIISTRETAMKTSQVRRHPHAAVCAFTDQFYGGWVQAEGPPTVEYQLGAMEGLVRYYKLVAGEHPDWDDYRAAMQCERRVLMRIQIERVGPLPDGARRLPDARSLRRPIGVGVTSSRHVLGYQRTGRQPGDPGAAYPSASSVTI